MMETTNHEYSKNYLMGKVSDWLDRVCKDGRCLSIELRVMGVLAGHGERQIRISEEKITDGITLPRPPASPESAG